MLLSRCKILTFHTAEGRGRAIDGSRVALSFLVRLEAEEISIIIPIVFEGAHGEYGRQKEKNERGTEGKVKGETGGGPTRPMRPSDSDCSLNDRLTAKTYVSAIR